MAFVRHHKRFETREFSIALDAYIRAKEAATSFQAMIVSRHIKNIAGVPVEVLKTRNDGLGIEC